LQVKIRTLLGTALLVTLLTAILIGLGRHALLANNEDNYQTLRNKLLETRKQEIRSEVTIALGLVSALYEETRAAGGDIQAAQKRALELLRPIRFFENKSGYFMVHALDGNRATAVLVPVKTELEGTDITELKDQNNKLFVQDFVKAARAGGGFVDYYFPNAAGGAPLPKITYIGHFAPWDWEIGAGVYIDDLEAQALQIRAQRITQANKDFAAMLAMALFALILIMAALWIMLGVTVNRVAEQLSETINGLQTAQTALQESAAFRKRVFESSSIPIVIMDGETHRFIDCNPAAAVCYRFGSVADTIGKTPLDVSAPVQYDGRVSAEKVGHYVQQAIQDGLSVFEWRHQRPDGELWDAEVHLMSFKSNDQQLLQVMTTRRAGGLRKAPERGCKAKSNLQFVAATY
jgi:PAS domain-containing protein